MSQWVICKKCGLKHRAHEPTCPRCENPTDSTQVRWSEDKVAPRAEASPFRIAVPVGLLLALLGTFVFAGPLEGRSSGPLTLACVGGGLLLISVSWAWTATVAFEEGLGWVLLAAFLPFISTGLLRKWKALAVKLAGVGVVVLGVVVLAPARGLADDVARLCDAKERPEPVDCECIGKKTVGLMTTEEQQQPFSGDTPTLNGLMLTADRLCVKERLVARCVRSKQGPEVLCLCLVDAALNAFSPADLETLSGASAGNWPAKYAALRDGCLAR